MSNQHAQVWVSSTGVIWSLWSNKVLLDYVEVPVDAPPHCPWERHRPLVMVVDAGHEEVERIASAGFAPGLVGRWQRVLLERDRRRTMSESLPLTGLGRHGSDIARAGSLIESWPESVQAWLGAASKNGLAFDEIYSAARLLALLAPGGSAPQLLVYEWSGVTRHVLCADGVACLTRVVGAADDQCHAVAVALEHVAERWGFRSMSVSLPPNPQVWTSQAIEQVHAFCQAEVSVRCEVDVVTRTNQTRQTTEAHTLDALFLDVHKSLNKRVVLGRLSQAVSRVTEARVATAPKRAQRALLGFRCTVGALLLLALSIAGYALVAGISNARHAVVASVERESLLAEIDRNRQHASQLAVNPVRAARRVQRALAVDRSLSASPEEVMHLVATHISSYPEVQLHVLEWRAFADIAAIEEEAWISDGVMQATESLWQTSLLAELPEANPMRLLVELAGAVVGSAGGAVGVAQRAAEDLLQSLQNDPRVQACRMLQSPLMQASEGPVHQAVREPARAPAHPAKRRTLPWRLRCILTATGDTR